MKEKPTVKGISRLLLLIAVVLTLGFEPTSLMAKSKKTSNKPRGKALYGVVWQKTRPPTRYRSRPSRISAVAGVRGSKEDKKLAPYWKGKEKLPPDLEEFAKASMIVNHEEYNKGADAFKEWLNKYPKSKYAPRVMIGLAVCYAYMDQKDNAKKVLASWMKKYPENEMKDLVQQFMDDLSSS